MEVTLNRLMDNIGGRGGVLSRNGCGGVRTPLQRWAHSWNSGKSCSVGAGLQVQVDKCRPHSMSPGITVLHQ